MRANHKFSKFIFAKIVTRANNFISHTYQRNDLFINCSTRFKTLYTREHARCLEFGKLYAGSISLRLNL